MRRRYGNSPVTDGRFGGRDVQVGSTKRQQRRIRAAVYAPGTAGATAGAAAYPDSAAGRRADSALRAGCNGIARRAAGCRPAGVGAGAAGAVAGIIPGIIAGAIAGAGIRRRRPWLRWAGLCGSQRSVQNLQAGRPGSGGPARRGFGSGGGGTGRHRGRQRVGQDHAAQHTGRAGTALGGAHPRGGTGFAGHQRAGAGSVPPAGSGVCVAGHRAQPGAVSECAG